MAEYRRLIKVFLGSPGDLQDERKTAKSIADEFNSLYGSIFQCQIDLVGWEDTVSTFGRPQETINKELDRCELFVGVIWKRWGTPPAIGSEFSSGFEEEFRRSLAKRRTDGRPEISVYFKDISEELQRDPGDQLKKVLTFKKELIDGKELLFESFANTRDFESKFRRRIASYVNSRLEADKNKSTEDEKSSAQSGTEASTSELSNTSTYIFSSTSMHFLRSMLNKSKETNSWNSEINIARFRLLSTLNKNLSNDDFFIGTHDSNILFKNRNELDLGKEEHRGLFEGGLENYRHETTPLWHWLVKLDEPQLVALVLSSIFGTNEQRSGALNAMRLLGKPIDSQILLKRDFIIQSWLGAESPINAKVSALNYLADHGRDEDIIAIRTEFDRSNSQTISPGANAIIRICLRNSRSLALQALLELRPAVVSNSIIDSIFLENPHSIENALLVESLTLPNSSSRRAAVFAVRKLKLLTDDLATSLLEDADAEIRLVALKQLSASRTFSMEEAYSILVKKNKNDFFSAGNDSGENLFDRYKIETLALLPIDDLERKAAAESMFDIDFQIALATRNFSKYGQSLRNHIDDHFKSYINERLERFSEGQSPDSDLLKTMRSLTGFIAKKHIKKAIDLICSKSDPADLLRIRSLISASLTETSIAQISYLSKHGEWRDIGLVNKATLESGLLLITSHDGMRIEAAAEALIKLGKGNLSELFRMDLPAQVFPKLLFIISEKNFSSVNDEVILKMLQNESERVRKSVALKCVLSLKRKSLSVLLEKYLNTYPHYYNAVHWLDMGLSLPQKISKSAAKKAVDNFFLQ